MGAGNGRGAGSERPAAAKVVRRSIAGGVKARGLERSTGSGDGDLVGLDRSDVLLVFGQVSPRQVAAPAASVNVRLVARFPDGRIEDGTVADVASTAIDRLLVAQTNVVSVATGEGDAPAVTRSRSSLPVTTARRGTSAAAVRRATACRRDYELRGVDLVMTLGESFLQRVGRSAGKLVGDTMPSTHRDRSP